MRRRLIGGLTALASLGGLSAVPVSHAATTTPIQHVVVIFNENVSFDHYFGTYPNATNPSGEPTFKAAPGTPSVSGLSGRLLTANPNSANPFRLDRSQAVTCDQNHDYTAEQDAFDNGLMNKFIQSVNTPSCASTPGAYGNPNLVMGYYDGNTVTGLWNLAQHFSMNDNSFGTTFGPSTPGALNLIAGQTHGVSATNIGSPCTTDPGGTSKCSATDNVAGGSVIGDPDPLGDDCSNKTRTQVQLSGPNIGDLLSTNHVTWGWFQGGFRPTATTAGVASCGAFHYNLAGNKVNDYSPHHQPFQYYASTSNPHHLPPSAPGMIGQSDQANHQYDLTDFYGSLQSHNLPAVSFVKASQYQDGHAGYSNPLDEQTSVADIINTLEGSPEWAHTAVVIAYDDSDGWYDHVYHAPVNPSADPATDTLNGPGKCGTTGTPLGGFQDRCGYGPRLPLLVVSPWAKTNYVDHTLTDQSSVLKFIETNWGTGQIDPAAHTSFDSIAGSLNGMFDFKQSNPRAAPINLDDQTGQVIPGVKGPQGPPGPTGPAGPHGRRGAPGSIGQITCRLRMVHHRIRVSCAASTRRRALDRFVVSLSRGHRVYGSASGTLRNGLAMLTFRTRGQLRTGIYTITVADHSGHFAQSVRLA